MASIETYRPRDQELETIVVDNASSDGSAQMVRREFPGATLIDSSENLGYADGNNCALSKASGDWLLLLNPDTRMEPGTLDRAICFLQNHPNAGALGARQIGPDGRVQRSLRGFPSPMALFFEWTMLSRVFPRSKAFSAYRMGWFDYNSTIEVDQPMATFLMMPRAAYKSVGALDSQFPIFFNDVDWCFRAKQAGWRIYYDPDVTIAHYGGSATSKAPKPAMIVESHQSLARFYAKHYRSRLSAPIYKAIIAAIIIDQWRALGMTNVRQSISAGDV